MTPKRFGKLIEQCLAPILEPAGFSTSNSQYSVFHRDTGNDVIHIIMPETTRGSERYHFCVFPTSPLIQSNWDKAFPDYLGLTTGSFSYLHSVTGVGPDDEMFRCETDEALHDSFEKAVAKAITEKALPYLDSIKSMSDLVPLMRHNAFLGMALYHSGCIEESLPVLKKEKQRLEVLEPDDELRDLIKKIDVLLTQRAD